LAGLPFFWRGRHFFCVDAILRRRHLGEAPLLGMCLYA
jgi:hypothetical protein